MIQLADLVERFNRQLERAVREGLVEPTACALATVSPEGRPSARMMLLKQADEHGFVFYTNMGSRKGRELAEVPWAALCFWWGTLAEQVRVEGRVKRIRDPEADEYFASRPRGSQLGAWASRQSSVLATRQELLDRLAQVQGDYRERNVPRPPYWSGFRLVPDRMEFWYGRADRLHERLEYVLEDGVWTERILSP